MPEAFLAGRAIARTLSTNFSVPVVLARNAWVRQLDGRVDMDRPRPLRPRSSGSGTARSGAPSQAWKLPGGRVPAPTSVSPPTWALARLGGLLDQIVKGRLHDGRVSPDERS